MLAMRLGYITDKGNAVFVKDLKEATAVLEAFYAASAAGEFDAALAEASKHKSAEQYTQLRIVRHCICCAFSYPFNSLSSVCSLICLPAP